MREAFYKLPIQFNSIIQKKELERTSIEDSIAQHIILLATTAFGECKGDDTYGSKLWEIDFDLLMNENKIKEIISTGLKDSLACHEVRIKVLEVNVELSQVKLNMPEAIRLKKKINISIKSTVKSTNRSFNLSFSFFVGPLS